LLKIDGVAAVTVDTLVAGVHFPLGYDADLIGYRLMAVNLSDIAAMGADPRWCTLALTVPEADEGWLDGFARGLFELASEFRVSLVGGDLTRGPLTATLQLIGRAHGARFLTRGGGRAGDDVYVTGPLGDGAAGLVLSTAPRVEPGASAAALERRFHRPRPRVQEGQALVPLASAAIDVSDGLLADLQHICTASGCGAVIDVERVPLSAELLDVFSKDDALGFALGGGDDYELCFTAARDVAPKIAAAVEACGARATRVGQLVPGRDVICRLDGEPFAPPARGYVHF
jgi:thiamine-monophosphate kinase